MNRLKTSNVVRQSLATITPLVVCAVQWILWPIVQPYAWLLFFLGVFISSWIGGFRAGLLATVISTVLVWWFFVPHEQTIFPHDTTLLFSTTVFIGMGVLFSLFHDRLRRSETLLRDFIEQAADGIFIANLDGRYTDVNSAGCRMLGYTRDEIVGKTIVDLIPSDEVQRLWQSKELLLHGNTHVSDWKLRRKDGTFLPVEVSAKILPDGRWQGLVRDISERMRMTQELRESHEALNRAQALAQIGSWQLDLMTNEVQWSDELYRMFGVSQETPITYERFLACAHPDDREYVNRKWKAALRGEPYDIEHRIVVDGNVRWVRERARIDTDSGASSWIGTTQDITESKQAEEKLRQAAIVFNNTNEGIMICDATAHIVAVNGAFTTITGFSATESLGKNPRFLHSGRQDENFYHAMRTALARDGQWQGEVWNRRKNGEIFPAWENISVAKDAQGRITHYVSVMSDISLLKQTEARLSHLAHHDALTGLPNRLLFNASLERSLERAARHRQKLALFFLDLDRFKLVNDTMGHAAGDRLLQEVSTRLQDCVRGEDMVARLGGDEFTIVLEEISSSEDAARLAEKINAAIVRPVRVDGKEMVISASIGIALYPDDARNASDLARVADAAMYHAKERGRYTYEFYSEELTSHAMERLSIENDLRQALTRGELELFYQPQFQLATGRIAGLEALLRWHHPRHGLILPERFIRVAEESGLIEPIGAWVLRQACIQAQAWHSDGMHPGRIAINVSGRQMLHDRIVKIMEAALQESGLRPENVQIELEITESVLQSIAHSIDLLGRLHAFGVTIAIDDFGTGYSSLGLLKQLPIDTLKIAGLFVRHLPDDADSKAITVAMIHIAQSLGLRVIAEGVETQGQLGFLQALGCDEIQGHVMCKAASAEVIGRLLRNQAPLAMTER